MNESVLLPDVNATERMEFVDLLEKYPGLIESMKIKKADTSDQILCIG